MAPPPIPTTGPAAPAGWRVELRRVEGGPWEPLADVGSPAVAGDEARLPRSPTGPGDLVRVRDPAGRTAGLWVSTPAGPADAGGVPDALRDHELDWPAAWEGPCADGVALVRVAWESGVPRAALVLAVSACAARAGTAALAPDDRAPRAMVRAARAWARGDDDRGRPGLVRRYGAFEAAPREGAARHAALAARNAVGAALAEVPGVWREDGAADAGSALRAARHAALALGFPWDGGENIEARRELAAVVRAHLPLSVVLLARAAGGAPL